MLGVQITISRRPCLATMPSSARSTSWSVARSRLTAARWEALSHVERWELSYLLAARDATTSNAEAWRWIAERNLLPGSQESVTNPSNAFDKRWRRYRDLVTG